MLGNRRSSTSQIPGLPFSFGHKSVLSVRLLLALLSIISSLALAFILLENTRSAAHADPALVEASVPVFNPSFPAYSWGLAFDKSGHIWVAEPQCDINGTKAPVCSNTIQSGILEYTRQGFSNFSYPVQFNEPPGYSSPFFLAFDSSGNLWFTEPMTNAIGELDTTYNWHQWTVPTLNSSPLDLVFDQYQHLWFTEYTASQIGEFDPKTDTFINEYTTPSLQSTPYGITGPDPTTNSIWFTENSSSIHRIGRISPTADGTINGSIQEYVANSPAKNNNTPHLITSDNQGNIWWSEGFDGKIGELVISKASNGTNLGVSEYSVPAPVCPVPPNSCGSMHISGIAVDSNGTVWFDDSLNSRYGSFVPSSATFNMYVIDKCITSITHPHDGLAVDSNNNIWIGEEFNNKLVEALPGTVTNPTPCPSPTSTTTPTPAPTGIGPTSLQWYFAEGKVGQGFTQFLTIQNPDPNPAHICQVSLQYLLSSSTPSPKLLTIAPNTRFTELVNADLNQPASSLAYQGVSTIVSVTNPGSCSGVVAERPIYFTSFKGSVAAPICWARRIPAPTSTLPMCRACLDTTPT